MTAALRPMNKGELLDRAFEIYRKNLAVFAGIAALPAAVMFALHAADVAWFHLRSFMPTPVDQPTVYLDTVILSHGYYHVSAFLYALFLPALVRSASNWVFAETISIHNSFRFMFSRWRSYLWLAILRYLSALVAPEVLSVGLFLGIGTLEDKLGLLGDSPNIPAIIVLLLPIPSGAFLFLWMGACLALAFPAAALEHLGGFKALRRSWRLSRGCRMRILGVSVAIAIIGNILGWAVYFLMLWAWRDLFSHWHLGGMGRNFLSIATYFLYGAIATFVAPLLPIAVTLFYYDQRVRKEGYDLERMMEAAGLGTPVSIDEKEIGEKGEGSNQVKGAPLLRWS
jgi:Membrane domain of glycerophosphoryl diester phosphodiesterase